MSLEEEIKTILNTKLGQLRVPSLKKQNVTIHPVTGLQQVGPIRKNKMTRTRHRRLNILLRAILSLVKNKETTPAHTLFYRLETEFLRKGFIIYKFPIPHLELSTLIGLIRRNTVL